MRALINKRHNQAPRVAAVCCAFVRSEHLFSTISLIPQTSTTTMSKVESGGIVVVESRKNGQFFRGNYWWNYLGGGGQAGSPARPPVAALPRAPSRALGSGHPAPRRGAPFATRSLCFPSPGQRMK
jgi:hypothetical protein